LGTSLVRHVLTIVIDVMDIFFYTETTNIVVICSMDDTRTSIKQ
jgi:hypothetical protein